MSTYLSQSARDAAASGYGGPDYWARLDQSASESHAYFTRHGDHERAAQMLSRTLSEALMGNDGE